MKRERRAPEDLERAATHVLEEARMVLPGIQALLGFQLIAVFSSRFDVDLLQQNNACTSLQSCSSR
jgi:hypothetical protein